MISWYWYATSILPALHGGIQSALGESYYHAFIPACVRRWAWRRLSSEGRELDAQTQQKFRALKELQLELAMSNEGGDAVSQDNSGSVQLSDR